MGEGRDGGNLVNIYEQTTLMSMVNMREHATIYDVIRQEVMDVSLYDYTHLFGRWHFPSAFSSVSLTH
ncbi:hypothetical protein SODALDRAFT_333754 [Sodiomyces alkalinus F11]|uniref:Uncharacterized protein n=1 Tax=Sodiomyces alkalinus (strain CBS 110278 / VKM F-3762 / F11) TaxID=1314773 RepID=A0A3N2PU22_SODAK|nr:hypothetical protein SODALDRAFT_333754 [Sodiomyces alkalinus F11]ROT37992.1 hypothetical protein SODALDRAFT_333754 [Sodiomyces alkalinus F11]